jgi:phage gp16-like protein
MAAKKTRRSAELAKIHILKKELGLDDDAYRDVLFCQSRKNSAGQLTPQERSLVINHMISLKERAQGYPGRPANMDKKAAKNYAQYTRATQLEKIEALLAIGKKPWPYADALAKRICKIDKIAWVPDGQLYKIIAALTYQAKREGRDLRGER